MDRSPTNQTHLAAFLPLFCECEKPIKQLEPHVALLLEQGRCLCFVKCNQCGDKGSPCSCGRR